MPEQTTDQAAPARKPLVDRVNGQWDVFEIELFNLVTRLGTPAVDGETFFFSRRLAVTQAMLDAYDTARAVTTDAERRRLSRPRRT